MAGRPSQFGTDLARVRSERERINRVAGRLRGFHIHIASNVRDVDLLVDLFGEAIRTCALAADELHLEPQRLALGSGFPAPAGSDVATPALDGLATGVAALLDLRFPGWRDGRPAVTFESGRALINTAGTLVARVEAVKWSCGERFVVLDAGTNVWGGMAALQQLPRPPAPFRVLGAPPDERDRTPAVVYGPLCSPTDIVSRTMSFPEVTNGSLVAIPNVGGYGLSAALVAFLSRPLPVEAVIDGDRVVHVSRVELVRLEVKT